MILDDAITSFEVTAVFLYSVYNKGGFGLIPSLHLIPRSRLFMPSQTEINQVQKPDPANQFYALSPTSKIFLGGRNPIPPTCVCMDMAQGYEVLHYALHYIIVVM